jgi:hypothetical protein
MANEYTQQEIDEILSRVADEMSQVGYVSEQTAKDMKNMSTGVKNYTENLNNSFKRLGTSIGHLAGNMAKGATGAAQYTDALGDAAGLAASALSILGPVGKTAGLLLKGMGESAKLVGSQADSVYKSFQELSKSGMSTAGGMSTVFNNMQKLGYSVEELGNFNAIVGKNSETLSSFGATAGQGLAAFAGVANEIKNSQIGFEFRNMGMSVDDINTGIAGFLKMQTLNGSRAKLTSDQLQEGSQRYIRELNLLSKLTGQSNEKLLQNREEMLAQERFAGLKYELQQRIDSNDKADSEIAKRQLEQINLTYEGLGKYGKEAQTGFINSLTGTVSDANAKFARTLPEAFAAAQAPVIDSSKILAAAAKDAATYMDNFGTAAAKIGASGDFGLAVQDLMKGLAWSKLSFEQRVAQAEKDRVITDRSTTDMTKLIDTQKNTTIQLQAMANAAFKHVVPAFQGIADTAHLVAKTARETLGVDMGGVNEFGGGQLFKKPLPVEVVTSDKTKAAESAASVVKQAYQKAVETGKGSEVLKAGGKMDEAEATARRLRNSDRARAVVEGKWTKEDEAAYRAEKKAKTAPPVTAKPTTLNPGGGASAAKPTTLQEKIIQVESGGKNKANQSGLGGEATSSAYGVAQITKDTFEDLVKAAPKNSPLSGKTFDDMKADVELQKTALDALTNKNRVILAKEGIKTTDAAMYLAHFLGPAGAVKALTAGDSALLKTAVSSDQIDANPNLQKMSTVGDLKAWADEKMGGTGYKFGGIANGPEEGYTTTLHGKEAVVPLPNGNSIPVEMQSNSEQLGLMSAQLSRLDDIVRVMQNQLGVSQKLLQYAQ